MFTSYGCREPYVMTNEICTHYRPTSSLVFCGLFKNLSEIKNKLVPTLSTGRSCVHTMHVGNCHPAIVHVKKSNRSRACVRVIFYFLNIHLFEAVSRTAAAIYPLQRIMYGLPERLIQRLQRIQNTAARLVTRTNRDDHITPVPKSLHWLPSSRYCCSRTKQSMAVRHHIYPS